MGFKNWLKGKFTRKTTANRPNANTRRIGSVAARERVRTANNKSGANGKMLANYNNVSAKVQKGRENAASRASAALKRLNEAVEREKRGNRNAYKNALNAIEDEGDKRSADELKEKVKDMRDQFDAATKKIVDDYMDDIEKQARELSKHTDANTIEKLKAALIKIITEGDMNPTSDPIIKKILIFILPLFLMAAPYMSKVFKKFKYNPGDPAYQRLTAFVDKMKSGAEAGSNGVGGGQNENNRARRYTSSSGWTLFSTNMLAINIGLGESGGNPNSISFIVLFIVVFHVALIISVNVLIFVFNVLVLIKRAIFDEVKQAQATGIVPEKLEQAAPKVAHAVVQQNPLYGAVSSLQGHHRRPPQ